MARADVLVVCVDSTRGWTAVADELVESFRRAGADARVAHTGRPPRVRTFALTDYVEARLARRAAQRGIAEHDPRAIVYCSINAALLWPRPGAISLDSVAAENRPGRHGFWQRPVERRRLAQAPLLLVWSERSLDPIRTPHAPAVLAPCPIDLPASPPPPATRDIDVLTYAGDPVKRRLQDVIAAWGRVRRPGETLVITGLEGYTPPPAQGITSTGRLDRERFRALLHRAKVFAAAPRREDYGIAALEALACGCRLVTTPSPGPYPARDMAASLDPRLVDEDLAPAIRTALDDPLPGYAEMARDLLAPYSHRAVDRTLAETVLPQLI
jgi:glycosyltransferase involved in cell wall biosynthesis